MFFVACEEVIQLDLQSSTQRSVVEAIVDAGTGICVVTISTTASYYETDLQKKISGATIVVTSSSGRAYQLFDSGNGQYSAKGIVLQFGETVTLKIVTAQNVSYTASTIVPLKILLDSIAAEKNVEPPFRNNRISYRLFAIWKDSATVENFYRLRTTVNDTVRRNQFSVVNDKIQDGTIFRQRISGNQFFLKDTIKIELLSVDKEYYNYFRQFGRGGGPGPNTAAAPFNPKGNFDNDVLGYFGVVYRSEKQVILN